MVTRTSIADADDASNSIIIQCIFNNVDTGGRGKIPHLMSYDSEGRLVKGPKPTGQHYKQYKPSDENQPVFATWKDVAICMQKIIALLDAQEVCSLPAARSYTKCCAALNVNYLALPCLAYIQYSAIVFSLTKDTCWICSDLICLVCIHLG